MYTQSGPLLFLLQTPAFVAGESWTNGPGTTCVCFTPNLAATGLCACVRERETPLAG